MLSGWLNDRPLLGLKEKKISEAWRPVLPHHIYVISVCSDLRKLGELPVLSLMLSGSLNDSPLSLLTEKKISEGPDKLL